jgi:dihydrofolate reductase
MIALVAGVSKNNCIGKSGALPWHIPEDMKRVRALTVGKNVVMGRKTWESLPEKFRPLPNRVNIVITRQTDYPVPPGVEVHASVPDAIKAHEGEDTIGFGGEAIFKEMILLADTLYITHVDEEIEECDAFFPPIDPTVWKEQEREDFDIFSFVTYVRK